MIFLFILGILAIYFAGVAASVSFFGYLNGRAGYLPIDKRKELCNIAQDSYQTKYSHKHKHCKEMTGWEVWAAWSPVWPLYVPLGVIVGTVLGAIGLVEVFGSLFDKAEAQAYAVHQRKTEFKESTSTVKELA